MPGRGGACLAGASLWACHVCKGDLLLGLGSSHVCKDGLAPAQPRVQPCLQRWPCSCSASGPASLSSLLLCPAANLSLMVRLPALGSGHQATPTLRLWSAGDPTLVPTCGSATGAPVLSPDSSVPGLQFLHQNTGTQRGRGPAQGHASAHSSGFPSFPPVLRKP